MPNAGWILANILIIAPAGIAWMLDARFGELYYRLIQEDHWMEWSTVWAFLGAASAALVGGLRQWRDAQRLPWFFAGLSLFCFLVAMEEISWGQRLLNFTPPDYFLAGNYQQELNLHNVIDSDLRQFVFKALVVGYGVLLPLGRSLPILARYYDALGVKAPPLALLPAFLFIAVFYDIYPMQFAGEWSELMLGLGMFIAIGMNAHEMRARPGLGSGAVSTLATAITIVLGLVTMQATNFIHSHSETSRRAAAIELEALKADFEHERIETRCGIHKRIYTFRVEFGQSHLSEGSFAGLRAGGLDEKRAQFFLDPWNMPYWIRHRCSDDREVRFVYSFGPNRRRDSTPWEVLGDDIGLAIDAGERAAAGESSP